MSFNDTKRQVVPRWLDYRTSCSLGLLARVQPQKTPLVAFSHDPAKLADWSNSPNILTGADLVAENYILGTNSNAQAREAAIFILKHAPQSSTIIRELAHSFLQQDAPPRIQQPHSVFINSNRQEVAILKRIVRANSVNPVAWSDLSLCYAMQGHRDKASRAMTVALSLGPQNRFILRNAARCFLHLQEPDRAIRLLRQSGLCGLDPWIAAAEIAISEGINRSSPYLKHSKALIADDNNSFFSKSEIAVALSTVEAKNGSRKKTKELAQIALRDPSENALAQLEWLAAQRHIQAPANINSFAAFEAQARHFYQAKQFTESLKEAEKWIRFEPFSARPLVMATFLASTCLDDDKHAIEISTNALPANRSDPVLLNNRAFSYARLGDLSAASNALNQINLNECMDNNILMITATHGLLRFRSGKTEEGRDFYRTAVQGFERLADLRSTAIATFFWATEEKRIQSSEAPTLIADAKKKIKNAGVFELENAVQKL